MSKLSAKIKEEIEALIPPTLFFFISLHLVALVRALMLKGTGIALGTSVSVTVGGADSRQGGFDRGFAAFHQPLPRQAACV